MSWNAAAGLGTVRVNTNTIVAGTDPQTAPTASTSGRGDHRPAPGPRILFEVSEQGARLGGAAQDRLGRWEPSAIELRVQFQQLIDWSGRVEDRLAVGQDDESSAVDGFRRACVDRGWARDRKLAAYKTYDNSLVGRDVADTALRRGASGFRPIGEPGPNLIGPCTERTDHLRGVIVSQSGQGVVADSSVGLGVVRRGRSACCDKWCLGARLRCLSDHGLNRIRRAGTGSNNEYQADRRGPHQGGARYDH